MGGLSSSDGGGGAVAPLPPPLAPPLVVQWNFKQGFIGWGARGDVASLVRIFEKSKRQSIYIDLYIYIYRF